MTDVRRVTLLAAALWIGLHLTEALVYVGEHRRPPVLALGLVLAVLLAIASLGPLVSSQPAQLTRGQGVLLVLGASAMTLCVHPFLTADGITTYANWPMGEVGVLVATLVLRECLWGAVLTASVVITSDAVAVWAIHQDDPSVTWVQGLFLSVPPLTWLLAALGIRAVLRRGALLREEYSRRSFTFSDEERLRAEVPDLDAGIGVSHGLVIAGNIGSAERLEYTVIGDPVNEAARLTEQAKERPERVVASERIVDRAGYGEQRQWTLLEPILLRGRLEATVLAVPAR